MNRREYSTNFRRRICTLLHKLPGRGEASLLVPAGRMQRAGAGKACPSGTDGSLLNPPGRMQRAGAGKEFAGDAPGRKSNPPGRDWRAGGYDIPPGGTDGREPLAPARQSRPLDRAAPTPPETQKKPAQPEGCAGSYAHNTPLPAGQARREGQQIHRIYPAIQASPYAEIWFPVYSW